MRKYCIYYHKAPNGKYYIGQTCQKLKDRWRNGGKGYSTQDKFYSAILEIGWENFEHGIIEENIPIDEIDEKEAFYISLFNSVDNGYNTYSKNYSNYHFSELWANEESRKKIILKLTQMRNTEEYHEMQSKIMKNLWETEEYRKAQKESWTEERKKITSEHTKENWEKEEYREKISKAQSEYRKKDWSDIEYRKKICKSVRCTETDFIFESVKVAAEWAGVKPNTLSAALKSKTHQSGKHPLTGEKLHWEVVSEKGVV